MIFVLIRASKPCFDESVSAPSQPELVQPDLQLRVNLSLVPPRIQHSFCYQLLTRAWSLVSSPYRNSSGVTSARFRRHTDQVCIPGVSISVTFTPVVLSHSRRFLLTVIRCSSVPHAIHSRWNC